MEILNQFGVQPVLLLAQAVNFLVLLLVLNKFLYKPILKTLKQRQERIAGSLKDAEEIEKRLLQTEEDRAKKLSQAADEAKQIINEATESAKVIISKAHLKATEDTEKMIKKAKEAIDLDRDRMRMQLRAELADLVALGLEKIVGKALTKKDHKEMTEKTIRELL